MCNVQVQTVPPLTAPAEYVDGKTSSPSSILKDLGDYISFHCTHGAKQPISHRVSEKEEPTVYCCLKCSVDFIWKQRMDGLITSRSGTKATTESRAS